MEKLIKATHFASLKHENQRRKNKNKTPYINHPIDVMTILSNCGVTNIDVLCAGLLHDTIEDTNTTYSELAVQFGETVADIVIECSDNKKLDKVARKQSQIEHADHTTDGARLVKLADKCSNLTGLLNDPPTSWSQETIIGYARWCFVVCQKLYGVNDALDKMLKDIFVKFKISSVSHDELATYYANIKESE